MIVTAHQPVYLPWLGFFHKMVLADKLVLLDVAELGGTHHKENFIARNKIKTPQGELWLSVPLSASHKDKLADVNINNATDWQKKHWSAIEYNYKQAPFFAKYASTLRQFYQKKWKGLFSLTYQMLVDFFIPALGLKTKLALASDLNLKQKKSDLILELCQKLEAKLYISGSLGKQYLQESKFQKANINIYYQNYHHPIYAQRWGEFIPFMSTLDLLFNEGPRSYEILMTGNITRDQLQSRYR